jgi:hypothetical protein
MTSSFGAIIRVEKLDEIFEKHLPKAAQEARNI